MEKMNDKKTYDFFAQGDDAERIIDEIFAAWTTRNISVEQAFNEWLKNNL